jgi:hypothetical protein
MVNPRRDPGMTRLSVLRSLRVFPALFVFPQRLGVSAVNILHCATQAPQ